MKILLYLIFGFISLILYIRWVESRQVFIPSKQITSNPDQFGMAYEDVYFKTQDGVDLNGWLVKHSDAKHTILYFHGNAGNMGDRMVKLAMFYQMGVNIFIIDYRGYGRSSGQPTEKGMYLDTQAAYDYLMTRKDIAPERIVAYGASLGGAAAVDLALKRNLAGLISDSTFTNAADMGRRIIPWVPSFLIKTKLDSLAKIKLISVPKLIIHSKNDEMIPFSMGQKLYDVALEPKTFLAISGGHNEGHLYSREEFMAGIEQFILTLQ